MAVYLLGNATTSQMFGFVINVTRKTIIFDGGTVGDAQQLENFIMEQCNGKVDAWFFTHPHHDHIGAFCELCRKDVRFNIKNIYHCFPSVESLQKYGKRNECEALLWRDIKFFFENKFIGRVHRIKQGEYFRFKNVAIKVLRVFNENITTNYLNNSSAVYRVEVSGNSFLILGDLGIEGGEELMRICPLVDLQTDYTQMAHHGQNGVSKQFYEYIKPKRCIWPTPVWLWNNDIGNGFDSGPFQTVRTREWMQNLGVVENWIEKDGIQRII